MNSYIDFLSAKTAFSSAENLKPTLNQDYMKDFQRFVVDMALEKGRYAIFAGTGLGKTIMQLYWASEVAKQTGGRVLILAPLAVSHQIAVIEANKFLIPHVSIFPENATITVSNYEKLHKIDVSDFKGVVLDESSILKNFDGKTRQSIIDAFNHTPYKLACTATPSPNDFMELGNHAEFLGVCKYHEMLATYFVHDGGETQKWRLKGHAKDDFWKWVNSWAIMFDNPSQIGFNGEEYILPKLNQETISVSSPNFVNAKESLFSFEASTLQERILERRNSVNERCNAAIEVLSKIKGPCVIWCNLNAESDYLEKNIDGAVQVKGSDSDKKKTENLMAFARGEIRVLITKPKICGFGLNWQHCHNTIFVGLNDSYEQVYQAIRRFWRFGQDKEVNVYFIATDLEGNVSANIKRKEEQAEEMKQKMIDSFCKTIKQTHTKPYIEDCFTHERFTIYNADCVEIASKQESDSIDYQIFSPPFESLYTYSDSERDMGNSKTSEEFWQHYRFLIQQQFRILKPGRLISIHCMNLPTSKTRDGYIGIRDFRGQIIKEYQDVGFIYHSEVCIWKDPVIAMQRTKALGLLHKQIKKDSAMSRQGIPDYVVTLRKPGENPNPISHTGDEFPVDVWQKYASPIWVDINPSDTLQYRSAREDDDEKHIAPLQLEVIRRCMALWSAKDDLVYSPFTGIGSEGYIALRMGRRFLGTELKKSYFDQAVKNLQNACDETQLGLF